MSLLLVRVKKFILKIKKEKRFPDKFFRGIKSNNYISEGMVKSNLFFIELSNLTERPVNNYAESINWDDDKNALYFTLNQKRIDDVTKIFQAGVAVVFKSTIDSFIKNASIAQDVLSYEREKIIGNPYHGNLLLKKNISNSRRALIAGALAAYVENIEK